MSRRAQIHGILLVKNTGLNVIGQTIPAVVAVITIPYIIHGLGVERFGILSLAWVVLGYFTLFDLGLGRATTKFVADALGKGETESIPPIVWTSLALQTMLGIMGGMTLAVATPLLIGKVFNIPLQLVQETKMSFYLLSASLPVVLCSATLKGLLEARQRFDLVNAVRIPSSSLTIVLAALAIYLGFRLPGIVLFLMISMIGTGVAYLFFCLKIFVSLRQLFFIKRAIIKRLFTYGGWIALCSIIVPLLIYSDRVLIGALISVVALGYYTAAFEVASRLQIIPGSFAATLFPAFSAVATCQKEELGRLYARSLKYLLLVMAPITLVVVLFARDILGMWLGDDFATNGTLVFQILAVGMLFNALSQIPANLLDSVGRPDIRAKLFLSYLLFYIGLAWILIGTMDIVGGALAWALRGGLELALFVGVSWRLLEFERTIFIQNGLLRGLIAIACLAVFTPVITTAVSKTIWAQGTATLICLIVFGLVIWHYVLDQTDKIGLRVLVPQLADNLKDA